MPDTTIPTDGKEIYDQLMGLIEPDLLTANLPLLEEKYKNEAPEQRATRFKRYEAAYAKYDELFAQWVIELKKNVSAFKRQALRSAEQKSREEEAPILSGIEHDMISASQ